MRETQFAHIYKKNPRDPKGQKMPIICVAFKLDKDAKGKIRGMATGFSYCSKVDNPNKKIGRMIAMSRAECAFNAVSQIRANLNREQFKSDKEFEDAKNCIATTFRTRYGQNKTELNENKEPYQTGHLHFSYIPVPVNQEVFKYVQIPDDKDVQARVILALSSIDKFGQL
ncbi:MAG: hypothetical protein MN733_15505 [Nitrososphaera sp.]|nr:hypothetical protein [Nitrososphaera sp.]